MITNGGQQMFATAGYTWFSSVLGSRLETMFAPIVKGWPSEGRGLVMQALLPIRHKARPLGLPVSDYLA